MPLTAVPACHSIHIPSLTLSNPTFPHPSLCFLQGRNEEQRDPCAANFITHSVSFENPVCTLLIARSFLRIDCKRRPIRSTVILRFRSFLRTFLSFYFGGACSFPVCKERRMVQLSPIPALDCASPKATEQTVCPCASN